MNVQLAAIEVTRLNMMLSVFYEFVYVFFRRYRTACSESTIDRKERLITGVRCASRLTRRRGVRLFNCWPFGHPWWACVCVCASFVNLKAFSCSPKAFWLRNIPKRVPAKITERVSFGMRASGVVNDVKHTMYNGKANIYFENALCIMNCENVYGKRLKRIYFVQRIRQECFV